MRKHVHRYSDFRDDESIKAFYRSLGFHAPGKWLDYVANYGGIVFAAAMYTLMVVGVLKLAMWILGL